MQSAKIPKNGLMHKSPMKSLLTLAPGKDKLSQMLFAPFRQRHVSGSREKQLQIETMCTSLRKRTGPAGVVLADKAASNLCHLEKDVLTRQLSFMSSCMH